MTESLHSQPGDQECETRESKISAEAISELAASNGAGSDPSIFSRIANRYVFSMRFPVWYP
jgi:hypothetical protein